MKPFFLRCGVPWQFVLAASALLLLPSARGGSLLVGDGSNGVIRRYDGTTGAYLGVFASGGGLVNPMEMAYGPDGNLYVADWFTRVVRYNGRTGAVVGDYITTYPYYIGGIAFGANSNLYVGLGNGTIRCYDATTGVPVQPLPQFPKATSDQVTGMTYRDGYLFVSYEGTPYGQLFQYDVTTGAVVATNYSSFNGNGPRSPRFGPDGNLYVPDWQTPHVVKFDGATLAFAGYIVNDWAHASPAAVEFGADGTLLVLDDNTLTNAGIARYELATGTFLTQLVARGSGGLGRANCLLAMPPEMEPPSLFVTAASRLPQAEQLTLTWTNDGFPCLLESAGTLTGAWNRVTTFWTTNGNWVSTIVTNPSAAQFYRLRATP